MRRYGIFRFYSVELGEPAARLSMVNDHDQEFWVIVPTMGKGWRQRRDEALDTIDAAIESGEEPGEVAIWRVE